MRGCRAPVVAESRRGEYVQVRRLRAALDRQSARCAPGPGGTALRPARLHPPRGRARDGVVVAQVADIVPLGTECQPPHRRVHAVAADDEVEGAGRGVLELRLHAVGGLGERGDRVAEPVVAAAGGASALTTLAGSRLTGAESLDTIALLAGHVRSLALQAAAVGDGNMEAALGRQVSQALAAQADRYPRTLAAFTESGPPGARDNALDFGIDRILDGLGVLIATRAR